MKKSKPKAMYIIGGLALALTGAVLVTVIPELRRYLRIRRM